MPVSSQRRLNTPETRYFGSGRQHYAIPDLTTIQTASYARFLQYGVAGDRRKNEGLESVLREIFPIESYDKTLTLDFLRYELGKPRYTPDECRQLRLTYGRPMRVWLRLNRDEPSASSSASCIAHPVSTSSRRSKRANGSCTVAALFPSAVAGSKSIRPRRTASRFASIKAASFP